MAGDISKYYYYDDYNKAYVVSLDKGNAQAMGFTPYSPGATAPSLPKRFKMRTVGFQTSDGKIKRRLPAPKAASDKAKPGTQIQLPIYNEGSQATGTFIATGRTGERQTYS